MENQTIEKQFRRVGEEQLLLLLRGTARVERLPKSQLIFEKAERVESSGLLRLDSCRRYTVKYCTVQKRARFVTWARLERKCRPATGSRPPPKRQQQQLISRQLGSAAAHKTARVAHIDSAATAALAFRSLFFYNSRTCTFEFQFLLCRRFSIQ